MKRFHIGFLINTWYGAFCVSVVSGLVFLLMYWWLGVYEELAILLMCIMCLHILFLLLVLLVAITNLARHHLFVGLLQVTLFFVLSVAFVTCLGIENYSLLFSQRYVAEYRNRQRWLLAAATNGIPFTIEFRSRHPAYSWYDGRVVFKSGKRSEELQGTNCARAYDVFKLTSSEYLLMPRVPESDTCVYRVNVEKQCAEVVCSSNSHVAIEEQLIQQIRRKRALGSDPQSVNVAEDLTSASPCKDCHYSGTLSAPVIMNANSANNETESYDDPGLNQGGVSR